jgi:hypothetical protein
MERTGNVCAVRALISSLREKVIKDCIQHVYPPIARKVGVNERKAAHELAVTNIAQTQDENFSSLL